MFCAHARAKVARERNRKEIVMSARIAKLGWTAALTGLLALSSVAPTAESAAQAMPGDGVVKVKSAYPMAETVARLKQDVASKGIMFFLAVDQSKLAAEAGIKLNPSTLLIFGNPGLGSHFITSNPYAGLDWPVRLLVAEDDRGDVWAAYTDFAWIARRHRITDRDAQFKMATSVVESITSSIAAK
jgi:uncharacterized protein (DUF302 family)